MIIGIPKETKEGEYRVSLTPDKVHVLVQSGHRLLVQSGAGQGASFDDRAYESAGATIVPDAREVFAQAEMIVKVKEPQPDEYELLQEGQILFTYLHLAADRELTQVLLRKNITGIGYETVQLADGSLPLLYPMSEIAGRMAPQIAGQLLQKIAGGPGKLLSGVPGTKPCQVTIIGGGTVGTNAALVATGLGARVIIVDTNLERLRHLSHFFHGNVETIVSTPLNVAQALGEAEVVIGAVLIPGALAPRVITRSMLRRLHRGSIVIDVAIDQGGCVESIRPTSHTDPTYELEGVTCYAVPNIPGAVPYTSSYSLSNATYRYVLNLANNGFREAIRRDPALAKGVNTYQGRITYRAVAETFGLEYVPLDTMVGL